ncbi:MAG TPA: radical SAM protein, partial [Geobacteraceae bacterium]
MNVLLVRPPDPLQGVSLLSHTRPMNLAYLAAYLRRHGIAVSLHDYELEPFSPEAFADLLREKRPTVLGVSCSTPTIGSGARLCAAAKGVDPGIVTVVGGAHANGLPVGTLEEFHSFDLLVFGEGEVTLYELCRAVRDGGSLDAIAGLVRRRDGRVVQNPRRPLVRDLDALPLPARDLLPAGTPAGHASRGFANSLRSAELFTSRGCPFACSFCAIQSTFGTEVRCHGLPRIAEEVEDLVRRRGCRHIVVADDTFSLDRERARAICDIFRTHCIPSWNCDTRVTAV